MSWGPDAWTLAAAGEGLRLGQGPFWDSSQLCGRPLFGAWGQPWSSPLALWLLDFGAWPLLLLALLGSCLLWRQGPGRSWNLALGLGALLLLSSLPAPFMLALALAPWALYAFWRAPLGASAVLLALFFCALHPALALAVLSLAYLERPRPLDWAQRVGWALLLGAPAWLPLFFHGGASLERGQLWPLLPPSEWLGALAWALSAALLAGSVQVRFLSAALAACLAGSLFLHGAPPAAPAALSPLRFNQVLTRYLDQGASARRLLAESAGLTRQASFVGALDGRGPQASLLRWHRLAGLGLREPDLISLSNVGWHAGARLAQPVQLALVDGAVQEGVNEARWAGHTLFQRPLKLKGPVAEDKTAGSSWRLLAPEEARPGYLEVKLPSGGGGWGFFSQSHDAGWRAQSRTPQGAWVEASVRMTEGGFLACPVPVSSVALRFQYRPPLFVLGLALSFLSLGFLAWKERLFRVQAR